MATKIPSSLDHLEPLRVITTVGQAYAVGEDSITLIFSMVEETQVVGGYITIPLVAINRIERLS